MPGFYPKGEYDLAGFIVGIVEKSKIITGEKLRPATSDWPAFQRTAHQWLFAGAQAVL